MGGAERTRVVIGGAEGRWEGLNSGWRVGKTRTEPRGPERSPAAVGGAERIRMVPRIAE